MADAKCQIKPIVVDYLQAAFSIMIKNRAAVHQKDSPSTIAFPYKFLTTDAKIDFCVPQRDSQKTTPCLRVFLEKKPGVKLRYRLGITNGESIDSQHLAVAITDIEGTEELDQLQDQFLRRFFQKYRRQICQALSCDSDAKVVETFRELKEKIKPGRRYPHIDSEISAVSILSFCMAFQMLILALACLLSGSLVRKPQIMYQPIIWGERIAAGKFFDYCGLFLVGWGLITFWLSIRIARRRSRSLAMLVHLVWLAFCATIFAQGGTWGHLLLPWIVISCYSIYGLLGRKVRAHFMPEFGQLHSRVTRKGKLALLLATLVLVATPCYILLLQIKACDNSRALIAADPWLFHEFPVLLSRLWQKLRTIIG